MTDRQIARGALTAWAREALGPDREVELDPRLLAAATAACRRARGPLATALRQALDFIDGMNMGAQMLRGVTGTITPKRCAEVEAWHALLATAQGEDQVG